MFDPDVLRGERDKGSHTTSGRQHGSSQTFVIVFLLFLVCKLKHPHRGPITPGPSQVALSTGSIYQPQHCLWCLSQEDFRVVFPWEYLHRMEVQWVAIVAPRKTYVLLTFPARRSLIATSYSGLWEEHTLVCRYQTLSSFSYLPTG